MMAANGTERRSFLGRRFDAAELFGLHFTLGILLTLLCGTMFALLACAVTNTGLAELTHYDTPWHLDLQALAAQAPIATAFFRTVTHLGDTPVLGILCAIVAATLLFLALWRRRYQGLVVVWLLATVGGAIMNIYLKDIFQRPRPVERLAPAFGWSFPSGHSMGSMVVYGMLAYMLFLNIRKRALRTILVIALGCVVGTVGFSRVYLGVHWPTDVLGGYAAGAAWLAVCITLSETLRRRTHIVRRVDPQLEVAKSEPMQTV